MLLELLPIIDNLIVEAFRHVVLEKAGPGFALSRPVVQRYQERLGDAREIIRMKP